MLHPNCTPWQLKAKVLTWMTISTILFAIQSQTDALLMPNNKNNNIFVPRSNNNHNNHNYYHYPFNNDNKICKTSISTRTSSSSSRRSRSTTLFGIPKMFRWLTDQYPNINSRLSEGLASDKVVDNFYLDMNGIIHPCTHGNNQDEIVVLDETAMFKKIFGYVDR